MTPRFTTLLPVAACLEVLVTVAVYLLVDVTWAPVGGGPPHR